MKKYAKFLAITLFFFASSSHAASWQDLDAAVVKATLADVTLIHSNFSEYISPDGSLIGQWGGETHQGKYTINDQGHFCSNWETAGMEEVGCWSVKMKKNKIKLLPESGRAKNRKYTVKLKSGNTL